MRIAVWHNLPSGGGKRLLYHHILALKERGHYLEAWTTDLSSDYLPLNKIITENRKNVSYLMGKANRISSPLKKTKYIINLMKNHSQECAREIDTGGFDVIYNTSCQFTYVPFTGLYSRTPSLIYLNEPDRRLFEATAYGNLWQLPDFGLNLRYSMRFLRDLIRIYSYRLEIRESTSAIRSYNKILVNSFFSRESVKRAYGVESVVCYPGVSGRIFRNNPLIEKKPFVAGMGRISQAKNIELAISALALIPEEERPVLFWISNGYVHDYFQYLKKIALDRKVDFRPLIDIKDEEIVDVLNEAAVFICTSHLEPFGLAPLEANLCGTYVVSVAEGGFRETISQGQNGTLISTGSPADLAAEINTLCKDLRMAAIKGQKAREFCQANWDSALLEGNIEKELLSISG